MTLVDHLNELARRLRDAGDVETADALDVNAAYLDDAFCRADDADLYDALDSMALNARDAADIVIAAQTVRRMS